MEYLNREVLDRLAAETFQKAEPYPYIHIDETLTAEGYERLRETLPGVEQFDRHEGMKRGHGQAPHNRFMLHYRAGVVLPEPWREFLEELQGDYYREFLRRMLGPQRLIPTFSWHYAWTGCSVSPHCDAARKLATHIFHFNDAEEWDQMWGGETLILKSERLIPANSAPTFDELKVVAARGPVGNGSLLFQRTPQSWHGMKPLNCPPGKLRKIFSVTINVAKFQVWWRRMRGKDPDGYRLAA